MLTAVYAHPVTQGTFIDTELLRHAGNRTRRLDHHLHGFLFEFGREALLRSRQLFTFPESPSYWMDCPEASGHLTMSTEDWQDPVTSRARQLQQALMLAAGAGVITAEFFDTGESRELPWARRPQAAALVAQLADPDRGWDAVVIGEYERAFYGSQYASMAPLFEHYGVSLWMPEVGGRVDWHAEDHEQTMVALGLSSKREITRTAMAAQTLEQGR